MRFKNVEQLIRDGHTPVDTLREVQSSYLDGNVVRPTAYSVAEVSVYFDDLADRICDEINKHDVVVGCVAWFSNEKILRALAKKKDVSFVVTKDDFLRPEECSGWKKDYAIKLRALYEKLPSMDKYVCPRPIDDLGYGSNYLEPVRCVGTLEGIKSLRCHHKFAVFGNWLTVDNVSSISPISVWTGSFNWSQSAYRSLENGVLIRDATIAAAYLQEWVNAVVISEPLDWEHEYVVQPEWRVGES